MRLIDLAVLAGTGLAACSTTEPNASGSPFLVSNPVASPALRAAAPSAGNDMENVVYISLPTGTIPNGLSAAIGDKRTGQSVAAGLVDGGLDPTAIPAQVGDTLEIVVSLSTGGQERFLTVVPVRARPKVVRTDPSPHKRDVPLNASIVVIFSEPIAASSLTSGALTLTRGSTIVSGQIAYLDDTHASVVFTPAQPLTASSEHLLVVTSGIRDQDGEQLEAEVTVPFTTGDASSTGELRVTVTSVGNAMDPDGYVLAIAGQSTRPIGANDAVSLQLPAGTYTVYLSGLAPYCLVLGSDAARVGIENGNVTNLAFRVTCPSVPTDGLLVTLTTQLSGSGWPADMTFVMRVDDGPDQIVNPNGYAIVSPIAPGNHTVAVQTPHFGGGSFCSGWFPLGNGWNQKVATVPEGAFGRVDFKLACIP